MINEKSLERSEAVSSRTTDSDNGKPRSTPYPRYGLRQVEDLATAVFKIGARRCDQEKAAKAAGYKNAQNGAFRALRASAVYFDVIRLDGDGYMSLTEPWIQALNEEDVDRIRYVRREAMFKPALYRALLQDYVDKQLPSVERLARELHINQKYGILKERAEGAAQVFLDSANFAGLVDTFGYLRITDGVEQKAVGSAEDRVVESDKASPKESSRRQGDEFQPSLGSANVLSSITAEVDGLDRLEIRLRNGRKAYLFIPVPLSSKEKDRLKGHIDLVWEEEETSFSEK